MNSFGTKPPVDIPMVRVVDEDGNEVMRGWYCRHVKRQPCVMNDRVKDKDVDHIVLHDDFADWNMPRTLKANIITPPHRIEVIDDKPWERGA